MSVFIGSIPNNTEEDLKMAEELLRKPNKAKGSRKILQNEFEKSFPKHNIFLFNRGRDALSLFYKNIPLTENDEVIVQAFTCVAVVAPILWSKARPIFVDIEEKSFNMNLEKLKQAITEKTKVIVIQHTFGNLVNMVKVREIVDEENRNRTKERKIIVVEDSAHLYNSDIDLGRYSDALLFSFAQDKAVSCTQGAMFAVRKNFTNIKFLQKDFKKVLDLKKNDALYNARYISFWSSIKKYYFTLDLPKLHFSVGKFLILFFRALGLTKKQASLNSLSDSGINKLSDIQAHLLLQQLSNVKKTNGHRTQIFNLYLQGLKEEYRFLSNYPSVLRFPVLLSNPKQVKEELRHKKIIVGRWYTSPVFPLKWENLSSAGYIKGSCPVAEYCCKYILNLPTNIEVTDDIARDIVWIVNSFGKPI